MSEKNSFVDLSKINVNDHIETKGKFSYLSWPFAVSELLKYDPSATWEVKRFPHDGIDGILPYMPTPVGTFVEVSVTVNGIERSQIHPILNNQNKPIESPTSFDINTSIQRALVKAIALHGLGLYIYAGEDLPMDTPKQAYTEDQHRAYHKLLNDGDAIGFYLFVKALGEDAETALFNSFPDGQKTAMKDKVRTMNDLGFRLIESLQEHISTGNSLGCSEDLEGITQYGKKLLGNWLGETKSQTLGELIKSLG